MSNRTTTVVGPHSGSLSCGPDCPSDSESRYVTLSTHYEIHRCRCTAYFLISFLQRLISQDHGYFPPFFEVLHFYKASLLCEIMHSTFADARHLRSLRARFPDLYDFIHDPGHHQQPCVYIRLSPWHTPYYVGATDQDVLRREHSRISNFYNYFGDVMPSSSPRFTTGSDPILTGSSVLFRLRSNFLFPRFGSRKANGNTCYARI